mmetsp:Transcript_7058/g.17219  ORF Transcript_7058/g.17219 Transcript_7058/m.17219 type:complete len:538 (-) Transcript_7058:181-1794(-)
MLLSRGRPFPRRCRSGKEGPLPFVFHNQLNIGGGLWPHGHRYHHNGQTLLPSASSMVRMRMSRFSLRQQQPAALIKFRPRIFSFYSTSSSSPPSSPNDSGGGGGSSSNGGGSSKSEANEKGSAEEEETKETSSPTAFVSSPAAEPPSSSSMPASPSSSSSSSPATPADEDDTSDMEKRLPFWRPGVYTTGQLWRRDRLDPARDNTYTYDNWRMHRDPWRHIRHFFMIPRSATFQRLLWPDLVVIGFASGILTYYNVFNPESSLELPYIPFMLTSTALGLLLVFRTTASFQRFEEARACVGQVVGSSRALTRCAITKIYVEQPRLCRSLVRLIRAFPRALIFHLTEDGDQSTLLTRKEKLTQEETEEIFRAQMRELLTPIEAQSVIDAEENRPLRILQMMSKVIHSADLDPVISNRLDFEIRELELSLGACERLFDYPIPTSYTRHTSRLVFVWCFALPFGLWPAFGIGTMPATIFITFSLLAIEDIGVMIEEPFDVIPLWRSVESVDQATEIAIAAAKANRQRDADERRKRRAKLEF